MSTDCFIRDPFTYQLLRKPMLSKVPPLYVLVTAGPGDREFPARCYRRGNMLGRPFYGRFVFEMGTWLFDPDYHNFLPSPEDTFSTRGQVTFMSLRSPTLGWHGRIFYLEGDREKMKSVVKAGDAVVAFFAWLFSQHEAAHACPHCGFGTEVVERVTDNDWYTLPYCDVCLRCGRSFNHRSRS